MVHKKVPAGDTGTANKFGGDDLNKWSDFASGVDVDDYDINSDTTFRTTKFKLRNPANTFSQTINAPAITAARTLTLPDSDWTLVSNPPIVHKQYRVFQTGGTTYVSDTNGKTISSNVDTQAAVQPVIDAIINGEVREFIWDSGIYTMTNPILLPSITATGIVKKIIFKGSGWSGTRSASGTINPTMFEPHSTFPNQRYIIECQNQGDATPKTSQFEIDGFQFHNPLAQGTKDVGAILLEAGSVLNQNFNWIVRNIIGRYMWRGLHLKGMVWFGLFENIQFQVSSAGWLGDACVILGSGGHTGSGGTWPKGNRFNNLMTNSGPGTYNAFLDIHSGSYNLFDNIIVDGKEFTTAVFNLDMRDTGCNIGNNTFRDIMTLDLDTPDPDSRQANLYMTGLSVYDNRFINCRLTNYSVYAVKLSGTDVRRNEIELAGHWGVTTAINDTGSGEGNIIKLFPGAKTTAGEVAITHTGGVSRIIDNRKQALSGGTSTQSGNGSTKAFTIAHGLYGSPLWWHVQEASDDAIGPFKATVGSTDITITYAMAPPSGSSNLIWKWRAGMYA